MFILQRRDFQLQIQLRTGIEGNQGIVLAGRTPGWPDLNNGWRVLCLSCKHHLSTLQYYLAVAL
jgi:hypothetical protein